MPSLAAETRRKSSTVSVPEALAKLQLGRSKKCTFGHRTRYIVLALGAMCISALLSNTIAFNFTVICMTETLPASSNLSLLNLTDSSLADELAALRQRYPGAKYNYSLAQKSLLFSGLAIGALVFVFPSTWLMKRFGARKIFAAVLFVSGAATGLAPAAANFGFSYFLIIRVLQVCL